MFMLKGKKLFSVTLAGVVLATSVSISPGFAESGNLPLRKTVENMQGKVTWNEKDQSVQLNLGEVQAAVKIGSTDAIIKGMPVKLDKPPYLKEESAYISPEFFEMIRQEVIKVQNKSGFELVASYEMPSQKAEIAYSTPDGKKLLVTEADNGSISIISIDDLQNIKMDKQVSFKSISENAEVTSVTVTPDGKYGLVAVRTGDNVNTANKGAVAVVEIGTGQILKSYEIGIGPDAIAMSRDGNIAVVCNEDEEGDPAQDNEIDFSKVKRPGSVSILSFPGGDVLNGIHDQVMIDLSQTGNNAIYKNDPQPEYVAISPDNSFAAVTLQENNAIAIIDLKEKKVTRLFGLGVTRHKADLEDDGVVSLTKDMTGRPEPDGIVWSPDGKFLITADEGDLGKDEFNDGVKSGGRNVMVWDLDGNVVYDSQDLIDKMCAGAGIYPDKRSPSRGSEVENLTVGQINNQQIMAVASERSSAILFFDVTDAKNPAYLGLIPSSGEAPEGIHKISNRNIFVSASEESGTLSFYEYEK